MPSDRQPIMAAGAIGPVIGRSTKHALLFSKEKCIRATPRSGGTQGLLPLLPQ